jgi:hypothetical protein
MSRVLRSAALICIALAGYSLAAWLMRGTLPPKQLTAFEYKLGHAAAVKPPIDVVFVGSSRVNRQISPRTFDATTAALGRPTRSFNLGVDGMRGLEVHHAVGRLLGEMRTPPRYVVFQINSLDVIPSPGTVRTNRFVDWHDPATTALALRTLVQADVGTVTEAHAAAAHLRAAAARHGAWGRGCTWLRRTIRPAHNAEAFLAARLGPAGDGFMSYDDELAGATGGRRATILAMRERFLSNAPYYPGRVAALAEAVRQPPDGGLGVQVIAAVVERIEAAGSVPIVVIDPGLETGDAARAAAARGVAPHVLVFNDPAAYPRFFELDVRFDQHHLNESGAIAYSRSIARAFVERVPASGAER